MTIDEFKKKMKEFGWSDVEIEEDLEECYYNPIKNGEDEKAVEESLEYFLVPKPISRRFCLDSQERLVDYQEG